MQTLSCRSSAIMPIANIELAEAKLVLAPIWNKIRPTAKRIRQHLEGALDWAIAEGHRKDESNPFEVNRLQFSLSFADPQDRALRFAALRAGAANSSPSCARSRKASRRWRWSS